MDMVCVTVGCVCVFVCVCVSNPTLSVGLCDKQTKKIWLEAVMLWSEASIVFVQPAIRRHWTRTKSFGKLLLFIAVGVHKSFADT